MSPENMPEGAPRHPRGALRHVFGKKLKKKFVILNLIG